MVINPRFLRRIGYAAALGAFARVAAQAPASATSGSPAAIAHIRAVVDSVERNLSRYRRTTHDLSGFSLEGGEVRGFFDGTEPRKLTVRHFGESGRVTENFYFAGGQPVFALVVTERYARPLTTRIAVRRENRFYFATGQLIRVIRSQVPASPDADQFPDDHDAADLLVDLKPLMVCAASDQKTPPACTREGGSDGR
jgi:hypothetical protein